MQIDKNAIYNMDCLEGMKHIPDGSVDMILCDLPYGITACKWDTRIPIDQLWEQYNRIIKPNGNIVLSACQPFTSILIIENKDNFKYSMVWDKKLSSGFLSARYRPLRRHEDILIFCKNKGTYNPQMVTRGKPRKKNSSSNTDCYGNFIAGMDIVNNIYHPTSILEISNAKRKGSLHPTQKPVSLFEYLIKTYSNEGETVLDNCMGSGTTAVACINTKRNYIGFEKEKKYFDVANERIKNHVNH